MCVRLRIRTSLIVGHGETARILMLPRSVTVTRYCDLFLSRRPSVAIHLPSFHILHDNLNGRKIFIAFRFIFSHFVDSDLISGEIRV